MRVGFEQVGVVKRVPVKGRGLSKGRQVVFEGAGWVLKRVLVVEEAPVGFLGGDRWC